MVWEYNPDPYDTAVTFDTGIGITFNQKIKAGSGNITIRTGGFDGTVVENFGIGSSVTIAGNELFFEDAEVAASNLGIALTKRGKIGDKDIPMCGVPYHCHRRRGSCTTTSAPPGTYWLSSSLWATRKGRCSSVV